MASVIATSCTTPINSPGSPLPGTAPDNGQSVETVTTENAWDAYFANGDTTAKTTVPIAACAECGVQPPSWMGGHHKCLKVGDKYLLWPRNKSVTEEELAFLTA